MASWLPLVSSPDDGIHCYSNSGGDNDAGDDNSDNNGDDVNCDNDGDVNCDNNGDVYCDNDGDGW